MPNQPRAGNPARAVRVEDELWNAAKAIAAERGESLSDVMRDALRRYVRRHSHGFHSSR
jgi:predicted transcriptional regulator